MPEPEWAQSACRVTRRQDEQPWQRPARAWEATSEHLTSLKATPLLWALMDHLTTHTRPGWPNFPSHQISKTISGVTPSPSTSTMMFPTAPQTRAAGEPAPQKASWDVVPQVPRTHSEQQGSKWGGLAIILLTSSLFNLKDLRANTVQTLQMFLKY